MKQTLYKPLKKNKKNTHIRTCKKCGKDYITTLKYSKTCDKCNKRK